MTIALALSRVIDRAAGQRRAVAGSYACFQAVSFAHFAACGMRLEGWSVSGINPDKIAPSRRISTP